VFVGTAWAQEFSLKTLLNLQIKHIIDEITLTKYEKPQCILPSKEFHPKDRKAAQETVKFRITKHKNSPQGDNPTITQKKSSNYECR
jgi:hypothetical protein